MRTLLDQANIVEMFIDCRSGLLVMCDGVGGVGCCDVTEEGEGKKSIEESKKKDLKWVWRKSNLSEKLSSKVCLGHSTMVHVVYDGTQCNKVDINVHDFLC